MLNLSKLKKGDRFYIFDRNYMGSYDLSVVECEVVEKFAKRRGYLLVNALEYVYPESEPIVYNDGIPFFDKLKLSAEEDMFNICHLEYACEYRDEYVRLYEIGMDICNGSAIDDWYEVGKLYEENGWLTTEYYYDKIQSEALEDYYECNDRD